MAGSRARESLNALTVARDTRFIQPSTSSAPDVLRQDANSASPLRVLIEKRTNPEFMNAAHAGLVTQGFPSEEATAVLHEVVNRPALARRRGVPTPNGPHQEIVQGVVIDETSDMPDALVLLRATVSSGKPPEVSAVNVAVQAADVTSPTGLSDLVSELEPLWPEFAVKDISQGPTEAPTQIAWLGETAPPSYRGIPADWTTRVRTTAAVLGMKTLVLKTTEAARAQAIHERVDLVFVPKGTARAQDYTAELQAQGLPVIEGGQPGSTFEELLAEFRQVLAAFAHAAVFPPANTRRTIEPGQTIYHRKVGNSSGPYDTFDEGSTKPCIHGGFKQFKHADKATKGMARLYVDFDKSWMLHCSSYPNCGVYVVRRPLARVAS